MNVLAIIPARGGSKSISRKNIAILRGRPLLAYTADAVQKSRKLTRAILSTDDAVIAETAKALGLCVPFLRPADLSMDDTPMMPVIEHAAEWLDQHDGFHYDVIVLLQPTSPLRKSEDIDAAVDLLVAQNADTVVSVVEVPHQFSPASLMQIKDGWLVPASPEPAVLRRQEKPVLYARNGPAVLAMRRSAIERGSFYGERVLPFVMPRERSIDIDDPDDLALAEFWLDRVSSG